MYVDDEISFVLNTDLCQCEHSPFIDYHHEHIITGDVRIVGNSKLGKLLSKGPNYWEPRTTNFNKAFAETTTGLDNCIKNPVSKTKYNFDQWKKMILEKINLKN